MRYVFADCVFDPDRHTLERQGQSVRLQPRVFKMLAYLLAQRHRVVSHQDLFEQVWPGQYISKAALEGCIKQVRQAIGDSGRAQRLLKTQHGVGYRLTVPVTVEAGDVTEPQAADLPLSAPLSASVSVPPPTGPERRQLTMLCCSPADASHLRARLDPDDLHAVMRAFHVRCTETIQRFGGSIAQRFDDGCLAYFGYPQAHDDAARRAVLAGLALVEAMPEDGDTIKIGIHTGMAVVEPFDGETVPSALVVGDVATVASALRDLAAPQTVLISAATAGLVEGYVTCQELTSYLPPGHNDTMSVYRVTGESGARFRLDIVPAQNLTPFVGRETEYALLSARWAQACEGRGQAVVVSGEAGIGKSRLVRMLAERLSDTGRLVLEGRGSPYHQQTAFYPIADVLRLLFRLADRSKVDNPVQQCTEVLQQYGLDVQAHLPFVAPLLNLTMPSAHHAASQLTPQRQRQHTFESLLALFVALADRQPVLFVLEDLHWADPSTLEWLDLLLAQTPSTAILVLLTCRPEFERPWPRRSYLTQVTLDRLTPPQSTRMVESIVRNAPLQAPVVRQIVEYSDGVPLFVEELSRAVLDTGSAATVPMTLQDALMARLDQMGEARRTAQLGAVIGRQFDHTLLRAVSPLDEASLQQDLHCLVDHELFYQRGVGTGAAYRFKHALIRDAAYQSLVRLTRQQIHQQVAQVFKTRFPEVAEQQPELLAYHYTEAGSCEQALRYWHRAGEQALQRSANVEAMLHLRKGLELLTALPDVEKRTEDELALRLALGNALSATKGFAAPEVELEYTRAHALCRRLGDTPHLFRALDGLRLFYLMRGPLPTAYEVGKHYLGLAQRQRDAAYIQRGHFLLGMPLFCLGELPAARTHLEQGGGPVCSAWHALLLWHLGYPNQARQTIREALTQQFPRALSRAIALMCASMLHQSCREWHVARQRAEALVRLGTEHELALLLAQGPSCTDAPWSLLGR
jgi:DNA-binding winged helix-turn-helix (wHTH) protein